MCGHRDDIPKPAARAHAVLGGHRLMPDEVCSERQTVGVASTLRALRPGCEHDHADRDLERLGTVRPLARASGRNRGLGDGGAGCRLPGGVLVAPRCSSAWACRPAAPTRTVSSLGTWPQEDWESGSAWFRAGRSPHMSCCPLRGGGESRRSGPDRTVRPVAGERGPVQLFVVILDYRLDGSAVRQAQVRQLARFVQDRTRRRYPTVVCGGFNAGPDADELRMLTGRTAPVAPGLVFYDAWEIAGDGLPATPGPTRIRSLRRRCIPTGASITCCRLAPARWSGHPPAAGGSGSSPPISRSSPTTTPSWPTCATNPHQHLADPPSVNQTDDVAVRVDMRALAQPVGGRSDRVGVPADAGPAPFSYSSSASRT